jgi:hypothetical protein
LDAVEEAQAGVGEVEVQAVCRQAHLVVDRYRGGGLQIAPGDRGVDHDTHLLRPNARFGQRLCTGDSRGVGEAHVIRPPAPLDDAGQLLQ